MTKERYYSLDVFRGATVALMILVNNPGSWANTFSPLAHASWHGCTPTDLVFPFFLFAVGNAMSFVMPKLQEGNSSEFWKKVIKRTVLIFLIATILLYKTTYRQYAPSHRHVRFKYAKKIMNLGVKFFFIQIRQIK
jgi:predicted acyltransferase